MFGGLGGLGFTENGKENGNYCTGLYRDYH